MSDSDSDQVPPEVVDERGASPFVGLSPATLRTLRSRGGGPPYAKVGKRVVYRVADLRSWLARRVVSQDGAAV